MLPRRLAWIQFVTLGWMLVECAVSLVAAVRAHSMTLGVFGADSVIELLSAGLVLLQFLPGFPLGRCAAERTSAVLLVLLGCAVISISILQWGHRVENSPLGIAITALALVAMPALALLKRREARVLGNRVVAADAAQSATCAWLAAVTLAGLAVHAIWRVNWVDSVAALIAVPILAIEAKDTWRGEGCACCVNPDPACK